jgi:ribosomal protein S18 acetylase RimI-like enzyme
MDDGAVAGAPTLSLRPAETSDEGLLLRIFAESHCAGFELMGLEPAALAGLIRMQFQARQAQYRPQPGATEHLIWRGTAPAGIPVGACWLSDSAEQLRVLDIAVLAEHRRRGIARSVLGELCARAAAAAKPVRLSVWHANAPALALYRELGFRPAPDVGDGGEPGDLGNGYLELELPVGATSQPSAGA